MFASLLLNFYHISAKAVGNRCLARSVRKFVPPRTPGRAEPAETCLVVQGGHAQPPAAGPEATKRPGAQRSAVWLGSVELKINFGAK